MARNGPEVSTADLRVECEAAGRRTSVRILVEVDVMRSSPLVSQGRYELVTQIVLGIAASSDGHAWWEGCLGRC